MQLRERKSPPVVIEDKGKPGTAGKDAPQKRRLSYMESGSGGSGGGGGGKKGFSGNMFICVALAVLISVTLGMFVYARKGDATVLLKNQNILYNRMETIEASANLSTSRIDTVIANYATKVQLGDYVTSSQLASAIAGFQDKFLDYYISGNSSSCTLKASSSRPGVYIGRLSLVYTTPCNLNVSTLEDAYAAFNGNWTGKNFIPEFSWNGTTWLLPSTSFYTSTFELEAGTELSLSVGTFTAMGGYVLSAEVLPAVL